jgi:DNA-binding response OmpR family regulator
MHQILIAEDEPRIAAFMQKGLRKQGYETVIAQDGYQTVEMIKNNGFDLLLLDIGLPIKDGWTVLDELQQWGKKLPVIIIVTARDDIEDRLKSLQFGINDYITKPFKFNDLLTRVQERLHDGMA